MSAAMAGLASTVRRPGLLLLLVALLLLCNPLTSSAAHHATTPVPAPPPSGAAMRFPPPNSTVKVLLHPPPAALDVTPSPPHPPAALGPVQLVLGAAASRGARCLDGSPASYFFRKGFGSGLNRWIIYFEVGLGTLLLWSLLLFSTIHAPSKLWPALTASRAGAQGGAWCTTLADCYARSFTGLGSSMLGTSIPNSGFFSLNSHLNPEFYNWNVINVHYCDGASYSGYRVQPLVYKGRRLYFRGRSILSAVITDALSRGLSSSEQVLVGGCSAGGLTSLLQCDSIRARMPKNATVKCTSDAGVFLDMPDVSGKYSYRIQVSQMHKLHNMTKSLQPGCLATRAPALQYKCLFVQNFLKYVKTPVYIINSNYDIYNLKSLVAPVVADPTGKTLRNCIEHLGSCTALQLKRIQSFRLAMMTAVTSGTTSASDGAYLFSCFGHCSLYRDTTFGLTRIRGQPLLQALGDWFFGRNTTTGTPYMSLDCAYPCNACNMSHTAWQQYRNVGHKKKVQKAIEGAAS
eukprot:SM000083S22778  [mRNA]  locus=s83:487333:491162:+ [translate_table: standard]